MLAVLAYRTAAVVAGTLPAAVADRLAAWLARWAFALRVPARAALEANLGVVLPGLSQRERRLTARDAFSSFARAFAGFLRGADVPARIVGREHLEAARASGRGVIVLSAHLGDWERGAALLAAEGVAIHIAARPQPHAAVERLFAARRARSGVRVLPTASVATQGAAALRRGEWLALMADRGTGRTGGGSVCAWAAALAQRTGALVLPAVCVRDASGETLLRIEAPLSPARCRDGAFRDMMRAWLARWAGQWAAFEALPEGLA